MHWGPVSAPEVEHLQDIWLADFAGVASVGCAAKGFEVNPPNLSMRAKYAQPAQILYLEQHPSR